MREFINIVESITILDESGSFELSVYNDKRFGGGTVTKEITIYENPSMWQVIGLCKKYFAYSPDSNLRGFMYQGIVYVWSAEEATHTNVQRGLGLEKPNSFDFYNSSEVVNFHVRGYGWQEGQSSGNSINVQNEADEKKITPLARKWRVKIDGHYY